MRLQRLETTGHLPDTEPSAEARGIQSIQRTIWRAIIRLTGSVVFQDYFEGLFEEFKKRGEIAGISGE